MNQSYYITAERMRLEKQQSEERGMACSHEPPLFPLPCHILAFFSSGSHEPCGGTEGEIVVAHGRMPSPARQNLLDLLLLLNVPSAA